MSAFPIDRSLRVFVAGHRGMVGSAIVRRLIEAGFSDIVTRSSNQLDLRDRTNVFAFFEQEQPEVVFLAAAKVGGILANDTYPADFLSDNLRIQLNVMDAAHEFGAERLVFLGSSCIYPKFAEQPISEDALMTGTLEPTNDAYAVAKIAGIQQVKAMRKQHGRRWISVMPSNLYGPGDNYDPVGSHVLPALIRRFIEARDAGQAQITNWGTGSPLREFLFVEDLADACVFLLENYDSSEHINVGSGEDLSIKDLAAIIAEEVGFTGETLWDDSKPDGTPRKLLDVSKINDLGWRATTGLREGIRESIRDFESRRAELTKM
ncbi:GDP-L-fucose synthase [Aquiluna sp.]|nr:GDP-L-fucose synthase [Aquiluna sp.]